MLGSDPQTLTVSAFLSLLPDVPWFRRLGQPHPRDADVVRLRSWAEWTGPECPEQDAHNEQFNRWYEEASRAHGRPAEWDRLWAGATQRVIEVASRAVDYDPNADPWYGPTACVWSGASTAALIACALDANWLLPAELVQEWGWYWEGHWPMWYARVPRDGEPPILLVF